MKHRDATLKKLDNIDSNLNKLTMFLNRGDRDGCFQTIESINEQLDQIKTYIENEPIMGNELNSY